jgi:ribosome biogenesis GTPase
MTGRVIRGHGKAFIVLSEGCEYACEVLAKVKQQVSNQTPIAVGDVVDFVFEGEGPGGIERVHPRSSKFSRPKVGIGSDVYEQILVSNVDQMVIVTSVAHPKFKQHLLDRLIVSAYKGGLQAAVVVNKVDLKHKVDLDHVREIYSSISVPVITSSAADGTGIAELGAILREKESIFVGHSGVGKSSLLNQVQPGLKLKTGEISDATGKGRHTTTTIELHPLAGGGFVVDTPGLKVLGLWDIEQSELQHYFPEFAPYVEGCKFNSCSHTHEPECAVQQALEEGAIFQERYQSYVRLYKGLG